MTAATDETDGLKDEKDFLKHFHSHTRTTPFLNQSTMANQREVQLVHWMFPVRMSAVLPELFIWKRRKNQSQKSRKEGNIFGLPESSTGQELQTLLKGVGTNEMLYTALDLKEKKHAVNTLKPDVLAQRGLDWIIAGSCMAR